VWGQHPDVHVRRYPPAAHSPAPGNGALIVSPDEPWVYETLPASSLLEMQPAKVVLPHWCPCSESKAEKILLAVAGSQEVAIVTGNGVLLLHRPPHVLRVEGMRLNTDDVLADTAANCERVPDAQGRVAKIPNPRWQMLWHPLQPGHMVVGVAMGTNHGVLVTKQGDVFSWGDNMDEAAGGSPYHNAKAVDIHGAPLVGFLQIMKAPVSLQHVWNHAGNTSWFVDAEGKGVTIIEVCVYTW